MIFFVAFLQYLIKLLILLLYFFKKVIFSLVLCKNTVYIICILTTNNKMTKDDIKGLLIAGSIVVGSYVLFYVGAKYIIKYAEAACIIGCI
jgi:hypothetical protein